MCNCCTMSNGVCDFGFSPGAEVVDLSLGAQHAASTAAVDVSVTLRTDAPPIASDYTSSGLSSAFRYFLPGRKWGEGDLGAAGGVVTWSIAGPDEDISDFTRFTATGNVEEIYDFDVEPLLRQAFAIWSDAANIEFIQVADAGGGSTEGPVGNIRVLHGTPSSYERIGVAYFPNDTPTGGNFVLSDFSSLTTSPAMYLDLALHEIGHALGLGHTETQASIMFPARLRGQDSLWRNDEALIARIYGPQDDATPVYFLPDEESHLSLIYSPVPTTVVGNALDNRLDGTAIGERIEGAGGNDWLIGEGGGDTLMGGNGADRLEGGAGPDVLDGGAHLDTAVISGQYTPGRISLGDVVRVGGAGEDVLTNIERIEFDDGIFALPTGGIARIARLYVAGLGRDADSGVLFWQERLAEGASILAISGSFVDSIEFAERFGDVGDAGFVSALFDNILGRPGEPAGVTFWEQALASGTTRAEMLLAFSDSPEARDLADHSGGIFLSYVREDDLI